MLTGAGWSALSVAYTCGLQGEDLTNGELTTAKHFIGYPERGRLLGFKTVDGFEYPAELEDRRVSNPDAFEYLHDGVPANDVDLLIAMESVLASSAARR